MSAYYNEHDKHAAAWLRELIRQGLIANGVVDERSIVDVRPSDLAGFVQCHFFAGIGGWSLALRLANWADARPVWTGSCPCQPFSAAGAGKGKSDERHLWPVFFALIKQCRPGIVFGEQVASSLVIGTRTSAEDVRQMLDREIILGVLQQQGRPTEDALQGVREPEDAQHKKEELRRKPGIEARPDIGIGCQIPGEGNGAGVQFGRIGNPEANRSGDVRTDRDSVRSFNPKGVEQPVAGPNQAGGWIHEGERPSGDLRGECDESQLGSEFDSSCCGLDTGSAEGEIQRIIGQIGGGAKKAAVVWLDGIQNDLEGINYSFGASVLAASSVGAPHIRQRLYWLGHSTGGGCGVVGDAARSGRGGYADGAGEPCGLADGASPRCDRPQQEPEGDSRDEARLRVSGANGGTGRLADGERAGLQGHAGHGDGGHESRRLDAFAAGSASAGGAALPGNSRGIPGNTSRVGDANGGDASAERQQCGGEQRLQPHGDERDHWDDAYWLLCRDGKHRRVPTQSALFPLADGLPYKLARRGSIRPALLKGAGNAIVPTLAAEFIRAFEELNQFSANQNPT